MRLLTGLHNLEVIVLCLDGVIIECQSMAYIKLEGVQHPADQLLVDPEEIAPVSFSMILEAVLKVLFRRRHLCINIF